MKELTTLLFRRKTLADNLEAMTDRDMRNLYDRTHYKLDRKARAGDVEAALKMARYWLGEGPEKSVDSALWYLPEPARAGNADARFLMMSALLDGINNELGSFSGWVMSLRARLALGCTIDQWMFDEAEAGGDALRVLVCMKEIIKGDAGQKISTLGRLHEYALHGSLPAAAAVGWCYWHGEGTTEDYEQAYVWLSVAKTLGLKSVDDDMDIVARKLPPEHLLAAQKSAASTFHDVFERLIDKQTEDTPADGLSLIQEEPHG